MLAPNEFLASNCSCKRSLTQPDMVKAEFFGIIARHVPRSSNKAFYDAMFPAPSSRPKSND